MTGPLKTKRERMIEAREALGITRSELAAETGLSYDTIKRIETGKVVMKSHYWVLIAADLGIEPAPADPSRFSLTLREKRGREMKRWRTERCISTTEMAAMMSVTPSAYWLWENKGPPEYAYHLFNLIIGERKPLCDRLESKARVTRRNPKPKREEQCP